MYRKLGLVVFSVFCGSIFVPSFSEASPECFMQDSNGRSLDVSRLCGGKPANTPASRASDLIRIPIKRRVSGIPTIEVTFNGRYKVEMLFDTGASSVVLSEEMAYQMGVKKEREIAVSTASGISRAYLGTVRSVQAGNLKQQNLVVGIAPGMEGGVGLLGQNFFNGYDVIIRQDFIYLQLRKR